MISPAVLMVQEGREPDGLVLLCFFFWRNSCCLHQAPNKTTNVSNAARQKNKIKNTGGIAAWSIIIHMSEHWSGLILLNLFSSSAASVFFFFLFVLKCHIYDLFILLIADQLFACCHWYSIFFFFWDWKIFSFLLQFSVKTFHQNVNTTSSHKRRKS